MTHDHDHDDIREYGIFHRFMFRVSGANEADIDNQIEARMASALADPDDWTIVHKMMIDSHIEQPTGVVTIIECEVTCARVVGRVPWAP